MLDKRRSELRKAEVEVFLSWSYLMLLFKQGINPFRLVLCQEVSNSQEHFYPRKKKVVLISGYNQVDSVKESKCGGGG